MKPLPISIKAFSGNDQKGPSHWRNFRDGGLHRDRTDLAESVHRFVCPFPRRNEQTGDAGDRVPGGSAFTSFRFQGLFLPTLPHLQELRPKNPFRHRSCSLTNRRPVARDSAVMVMPSASLCKTTPIDSLADRIVRPTGCFMLDLETPLSRTIVQATTTESSTVAWAGNERGVPLPNISKLIEFI